MYASAYHFIFFSCYLRGMAPMIDTARLVTVQTFADRYNGGAGVTRAYIYKLIKQGKVDTVKIDGAVFVVLPAAPPAR